MAEVLGTTAKVDPGLRCGLRREPTHGAEKARIGQDLYAEAAEAIKDNRVIGHARIWRGTRCHYT